MPLAPEQKRQFLIDNGYDPDKYDLDEIPIGSDVNAPAPQVPVNNQVTPPITTSQSFMEGLKNSIIPTGASLGASALALKGLSAVPNPWIKIPAAIGSGLVASYGAGKLQEKALESAMSPEDYQARLLKQKAASEQHGIANLLGTLIPSFVGFGPYGLEKVASGLMKLPKQAAGAKALLEAEKTALSGAALNTGLAGGGEAVREKLSDEDISPTKIALAALVGGTLQNQPWGVGKKMFPSMEYKAPNETTTPIKPIPVPSKDESPVIKTSELPEAVRIEDSVIKPTADKELITELQGKEIRPSLENDQSPIVKAGQQPNRPNIEEGINPDPTEKFYQEEKSNTKSQEKWNKDQLIPNTNFGYKISRWSNTPEGLQTKSANQMVGTLKNKFPSEYELMKDLGLEKHLVEEIPNDKITGKYIDQWIQKNGPKVEIRELNAISQADPRSLKHAELTHSVYDKLSPDERFDINQFVRGGNENYSNLDDWFKRWHKTTPELESKLKEYINLSKDLLKNPAKRSDNSESATARYTMVNPKPLDQMPGAVDLLVRIPVSRKNSKTVGEEFKRERPPHMSVEEYETLVPKYTSNHYPTEGKNLLAHVRGYMETTPDGKKVFHVFEVQSDWAQYVRDNTQVKASDNPIVRRDWEAKLKRENDPLLKHYERLALKSAISHAIKQGADSIALSDYPTAALTEGWDQFQYKAKQLDGFVNKSDLNIRNKIGSSGLVQEPAGEVNDVGTLVGGGKYHYEKIETGYKLFIDKLPFEGGGSLHYDQTLPRILEDLTGEKGRLVDFGEHQNTKQRQNFTEGEWADVNTKATRKDLIFRNPDGTPKTTSTARLYSLNKAKEIINNQEGISLLGNKLYKESNETTKQIGVEPTPKDYELANKRNVEIERVPEIISKDTNKPVRGEALPDQRKALVTDIATSDTPAHEISHTLLEDMGKSKLQADRDFYNKGIKLAGSKEALVEAAGLRYEEIDNKPLRTWFEDLGSNVKRLTRIAESSKDYERILARKLRDDRPYKDSPEYIKESEAATIKPRTEELYSEDKKSRESNESNETVNIKKEPKPYIFKKLGSTIDKLKESGPQGKLAAEAADKAFHDMTRYEGEITNALLGETKNLSRSEHDAIAAYIYKQRGFEIPSDISIKEISPKAKAIIDDKIHPILKRVVELQKTLPYERYIKEDPKYRGPVMVDPKVVEQLNKLPENSVIKKKLINDYVNHQVKYNKDIKGDRTKATAIFNDYIRGLGSSHGTPEFQALRKAEGYGLPFSWMDKDIGRLFKRYGDRVSKDLSYFKNIESDKNVASLFGAGKNIEGQPALFNENLKVIKRLLQGDFTRKDAVTDTAESFTRALILGPLTGIKNIVGSINKSLIYTPIKDLPKIAESFFYLDKGLKDSLKMGVNRHDTLDIFTRNDEGISHIADNFRKVASAIRTFTGANKLEQLSRARTQAQGDLLTRSIIGRYTKSGDIQAAKWLNQFKDKEMNLLDFKSKDISEDTISRIAANFVERVEGTYDARGLPSGLLEPTSMFYYLGSLSKWSVETGNVIKKDVINPILSEGDWAPFLKYTLGSLAVAGPLISLINETFSGGKKSQYPNFKELEAKGEIDDYTHKILELGSLAGFLGIYGDLAKASMDLAKGIKPKGYNVPSLEISADIIREISLAGAAVKDGQDPIKTGIELISNIIEDTFQAYRILHNQFIPEDIERANKFRDKRVYDRMSDKKMPLMSGDRPDRYGNEDVSRFKKSKSFQESVEILTKEIYPRISKETDMDKRKTELEGLKRNSYQTMPSTTDPIELSKYYDYLVKTQGKEEADKRLSDKLMQDFLNKQKSKIIPNY